jgi:hypothetical protein
MLFNQEKLLNEIRKSHRGRKKTPRGGGNGFEEIKLKIKYRKE